MAVEDSKPKMKLASLLLCRCPRCGKGPLFVNGPQGFVGITNDECRVCGLRFLRESGYFLGAIYISYGLGMFTVLPLAIIMAVVLHWSLVVVLVVSLLQTFVSVPLFMRFSRAIWLYLDQRIDPR